jgi:hypothetical protein
VKKYTRCDVHQHWHSFKLSVRTVRAVEAEAHCMAVWTVMLSSGQILYVGWRQSDLG